MRIFALELDNDIQGLPERKKYIETLISKLPNPDLVVLPEMAVCRYMASQEAWPFADRGGRETSAWAMEMAKKYSTCIGAGYIDREAGEYYNRYLIADGHKVYGFVSKCEGESAVFKRGNFESIIHTPFGSVAVGICYDSRRKHFYDKIKNEPIALILFPHGCPADPKKPQKEIATVDSFCKKYEAAFNVPVVYVNSVGSLPFMPGRMGELIRKHHFKMNGRSKIYCESAKPLACNVKEAIAVEVEIIPRKRSGDIRFYGDDIVKGNWLFRNLILKRDMKNGIMLYEANK